jgi:hypothetical protein
MANTNDPNNTPFVFTKNAGRGLGSANTGATGNGDTNQKVGVSNYSEPVAPKAQVAGIGTSGTLGEDIGKGKTLDGPNPNAFWRSAAPGAVPTPGGAWNGFGYYVVRKNDITGWDTIPGTLGDVIADENSQIAQDLKAGDGVLPYFVGFPVITGDPKLDLNGPVLVVIPPGVNVAEALEAETKPVKE